MKIFIATISTWESGTIYFADRTKDGLKSQVVQFVRKNWNKERVQSIVAPIPESDETAIEVYFELAGAIDAGGETLEYGDAELADLPETAPA